MNYSSARSFLSPRAIQNARTRIFIPGSDPRFASAASASNPLRPQSAGPRRPAAPFSPRLFSPQLVDRLHAPLSRYAD